MAKVPIDPTTKGKKVYGSLTKSADLLDERVSEVSNVSKTISNMQKNVNKKVRETKRTLEDKAEDKDLEQVHKSINSVLARLGDTIGALSNGITNVTVATAKATKDAIGDYASAVGRDINYNKQNIVAMALSRTSPIFGYFAAKFMETDVFRKAKEKITTSISNMFGTVFRKLRFSRKGKKDEYDLPHMARGGLVRKAGVAKLHAAEVVMPVDKYIKANQKNQEAFANRLAKVQAKVFKETIGYENIGGVARKARSMSYQDRMVELVQSIERALYEQDSPSFFRRMWDSMMENSVFRGFVNTVSFFKKIITGPFKMIFAPLRAIYKFGTRRWRVNRGYWADLPKGKNILENVNSTLGLTYAQQMSRLDSIILYTKATAQAVRDLSTYVTGIKYPAIPDISRGGGGFTIFGILRKVITKPVEWITKGTLLSIEKIFGVKTSGLRKALTYDLLSKPKDLWYKLTTSKRQKELDAHPLLQAGLGGTKNPVMRKMISSQRDYYDLVLHKRRGFPKLLGYSKDTVDELREINRREKRRTITGILGSLFGFASSGIGNIFKGIGGLFSSLGGGIFGLLGPLLGWLLGGKGGGGKGGFLGGIIKRAGSLVGRSVKWGFWNFLGMFKKGGIITKVVEYAMKPISAIGSSILSALKNFGPNLIKMLPSILGFASKGLMVAAAAGLGWEIGKYINEDLGLGAKIQSWLDERVQGVKRKLDEKESANYSQNLAKQVAGGTGSIEDYRKRQELALRSSLGSQAGDVGFVGSGYLDSIEKAQRMYMSQNLDKYLIYGADQVREMRSKWMNSNWAMRGALPFEDVEAYARRREESFLRFMSVNGKVLTEEQQAFNYKKFQEQYQSKPEKILDAMVDASKEAKNIVVATAKNIASVAEEQYSEAKRYLQPKFAEISEMAIEKGTEVMEYTTEAFEKRHEIFKNAMAEVMGPAEAIMGQIDEQTKDLRESAKETGNRMLQGAGHVATTVANSVTQTTQNVVNNSGGKFNSFVNSARESLLVMRGDTLY
jgi:hypothetical protein